MFFAEEFRDLIESAYRYLVGASSVHELNGRVNTCVKFAKATGVSPHFSQLLGEWHEMIDRHWNEWGHCQNPLTEQEFRVWLSKQLMSMNRDPGCHPGPNSP